MMLFNLIAWLKQKFKRKPKPELPRDVMGVRYTSKAPPLKPEIRGQTCSVIFVDEADDIKLTCMKDLYPDLPDTIPSWLGEVSVYAPPKYEGGGGKFSGGGASASWSSDSSSCDSGSSSSDSGSSCGGSND
ncbi:MAG TPA: hypothetical protein VE954_43180 [Oligoflexus sp.]|uniref:hypothetical protein n=1 Tax=Oligoflexus sp. TaxID=1971216 RepID=UPI002D51028F|nr:hypothetical protein [Oligoflexus sp.]HYX39948.1 hypothetical protein [Oligoflexus sp.]